MSDGLKTSPCRVPHDKGRCICEANDRGDLLHISECSEICDVRIPSGPSGQRPYPFWPFGPFPSDRGNRPLVPKGSLWCVLSLSTIFVLLPLFKKNRRKMSPGCVAGRQGEMYAYAFALCAAVKRFRMAANWQRAAVPVGRSLPSVPLMKPWPTAHCMAGTAQPLTVS